jgi:hypothetical protein
MEKDEIEVTPEMIEAGIAAAERWLGESLPSPYISRQMVVAVFEAMGNSSREPAVDPATNRSGP